MLCVIIIRKYLNRNKTENSDETEASNVRRNYVNFPSNQDVYELDKELEERSVFLADIDVEEYLAVGDFVGENSEPLFCKL